MISLILYISFSKPRFRDLWYSLTPAATPSARVCGSRLQGSPTVVPVSVHHPVGPLPTYVPPEDARSSHCVARCRVPKRGPDR